MSVIMWRNKFSGETGYVKSIKPKAGHFVNTYEQSEAKKYKDAKSIDRALDVLVAIGEGNNNYFEVIAI